jgi:hypothetical protein
MITRVGLQRIGMASTITIRLLASVFPRTIHGTRDMVDGIAMIHSGVEHIIPRFMLVGITGTPPCFTATHTMATIIMQTLVAEHPAELPGILDRRGAVVP